MTLSWNNRALEQALSTGIIRGGLRERYLRTRSTTRALCEGLSADDCQVQSMPDASPLKWHLAHTSWFFETFVLIVHNPSYVPFNSAFAGLFNSYYQSVGTPFPRSQRGLLTRPSLEDVLAYRAYVDTMMGELFGGGVPTELRARIELGIQHEQQHQELMLTDLKHALSINPLRPAFRIAADEDAPADPVDPSWHERGSGLIEIGHAGTGFAFDNERPRHRVWLDAHALASRTVTNAEYLAFVRDGGYRTPTLWLADGWNAVLSQGWSRPLYWNEDASAVFTLHGLQSLDPGEPVCHVSFYEADAYARWAGARLPLEAEWELAASSWPIEGNFLDGARLHPRRAAGEEPEFFGNVWEWTASPYVAYPGYRSEPGALGEYNGKFMCNQMVLRGGSCASPASHLRASYRNFFPADARWQFSGIRLARNGA